MPKHMDVLPSSSTLTCTISDSRPGRVAQPGKAVLHQRCRPPVATNVRTRGRAATRREKKRRRRRREGKVEEQYTGVVRCPVVAVPSGRKPGGERNPKGQIIEAGRRHAAGGPCRRPPRTVVPCPTSAPFPDTAAQPPGPALPSSKDQKKDNDNASTNINRSVFCSINLKIY
jgi:hypothetical protein